jgi:hypothetical protein
MYIFGKLLAFSSNRIRACAQWEKSLIRVKSVTKPKERSFGAFKNFQENFIKTFTKTFYKNFLQKNFYKNF